MPDVPVKPRTVYARMVADIFHRGHVAYLGAARALGDRLVVYVIDDAHAAAVKRPPLLSQADRIAVVAACRYVDEVVASGPREIDLPFMQAHGYDLYAYGYGDMAEAARKRNVCRALPPEMIAIIPYTTGISSTEIRSRIMACAQERPVSDG